MRRLLALLLIAGSAVAQEAAKPPASAHLTAVPQVSAEVTERLVPVSHSDMYCSGFLAKGPARTDTYVMGGLNSPNQTRFHAHDFVFINGDYAPGTRVSFVRQTKDVDRMEAFKGQAAALKSVGDVFGDLGYAVVVEKRGESTVAQVEFTCDAIVPGDYVVPFVAKPDVNYRQQSTVNRFPENAKTEGRIIAARDFDQFVSTGQKVYFDIGAQKGVKPGDMFLVVRNYSVGEMDETDRYELKTGAFEETRKNEPKMPKHMESKLPERAVAEAVVISANDRSATAMITFALSEVHVGDRIAAESAQQAAQYNGASSYAETEHSAKGAKLGPLCMFAILNCGKQAEENNATHATAAAANAAPATAAPAAGGSK